MSEISRIRSKCQYYNTLCEYRNSAGNHMPVYFIAQIRIHDETEYQKYIDQVSNVFKKHNGKYLAVDNHGHVTNDGDLQVELFQQVGSDRVGANMDTMNYRWAGHSLEKIAHFYQIVAPYTFHSHMKDGRSDH